MILKWSSISIKILSLKTVFAFGKIRCATLDCILTKSIQLHNHWFGLRIRKGIWRNGRRCGLNQIEPRHGDMPSDSFQIQGNLGLFGRQSWAKSRTKISNTIFGWRDRCRDSMEAVPMNNLMFLLLIQWIKILLLRTDNSIKRMMLWMIRIAEIDKTKSRWSFPKFSFFLFPF